MHHRNRERKIERVGRFLRGGSYLRDVWATVSKESEKRDERDVEEGNLDDRNADEQRRSGTNGTGSRE